MDEPTYETYGVGRRETGDGVTSFGQEPNTAICSDCSALIPNEPEHRQNHTTWHRRVKTAAMGFPLGKSFGGL